MSKIPHGGDARHHYLYTYAGWRKALTRHQCSVRFSAGLLRQVQLEMLLLFSYSQIEKQISGIVGFEIEIEKNEAVYKMSQNRNDEDYKNIIAELDKLEDYNAKMVARRMSELRKIV